MECKIISSLALQNLSPYSDMRGIASSFFAHELITALINTFKKIT